ETDGNLQSDQGGGSERSCRVDRPDIPRVCHQSLAELFIIPKTVVELIHGHDTAGANASGPRFEGKGHVALVAVHDANKDAALFRLTDEAFHLKVNRRHLLREIDNFAHLRGFLVSNMPKSASVSERLSRFAS